MALFKYFKRTEGHCETPPSLTTKDIKKANESIAKALEVKGRAKYNTPLGVSRLSIDGELL